jgi:hypothetical protein
MVKVFTITTTGKSSMGKIQVYCAHRISSKVGGRSQQLPLMETFSKIACIVGNHSGKIRAFPDVSYQEKKKIRLKIM